jgi:hypothetical protein
MTGDPAWVPVSVPVSIGCVNDSFCDSGFRVGCAISPWKCGILSETRVPNGALISVRSEVQVFPGPWRRNALPRCQGGCWSGLFCGGGGGSWCQFLVPIGKSATGRLDRASLVAMLLSKLAPRPIRREASGGVMLFSPSSLDETCRQYYIVY